MSFSKAAINTIRRQYATKRSNPQIIQPKYPPSPNLEHTRMLRISKSLSWLLRHSGRKEGILIRPDGFARVRDLLNHGTLHQADFTDIDRIVKTDSKKRFMLSYEPYGPEGDCWWIRANQGHSMEAADLAIEPIISPEKIPMAVHGTTEQAWKRISKEGISRKARNHIHLARGFAGKDAKEVFSGVRDSSRILIYVDVKKAMEDGIKFFRSANGVILCPGNDLGILEPKYFERVEKVSKQLQHENESSSST